MSIFRIYVCLILLSASCLFSVAQDRAGGGQKSSQAIEQQPELKHQLGNRVVQIPPPKGFVEAYSQLKSIRDYANATEGSNNEILAVFITSEDAEMERRGEIGDLAFYAKVSMRRDFKETYISQEDFGTITSIFKTEGVKMLNVNSEKMKSRVSETQRNLNALSKKDAKLRLEAQEVLGEIEKSPNTYGIMLQTKTSAQIEDTRLESLELRTICLIRVKDRLLYVYTSREYKSKEDVEILKSFTTEWLNQIMAANRK